ncbi:hypothetical protein ABPG74_002363 [Tetrahymena malaccensis]
MKVMVLSLGFRSMEYKIQSVGSIFKKLNEESEQKKDNLIIVNRYMRKKNIPNNLQSQIRYQLEFYWNESLSEQIQKEQSLVDQLSNDFKVNLKFVSSRSLIQESEFFKGMFSKNTLNRLALASIEKRCYPDEVIYNKGDSDDCSIYFIEKGSVQCCYYPYEQNKQTKQIINLNSKQFFGEIEFITGQQRNQLVRSLHFSTLIKINRDTLIQIVKENEQDYQKLCMMRDDILLNQNYSSVDFQHFEKDCPVFHLIPDKKKMMQKFLKDSPLEFYRQQFDRKLQSRFKFFENQKSIQFQQSRYQCDYINRIDDYIGTYKLLNETVFSDEDLSDSIDSSDQQDSQHEKIQEEDFSDSDQIEQEQNIQQIQNQNSLKYLSNQKSIVYNKNQNYSSQISNKSSLTKQIQQVPSKTEIAFNIDQGIDSEEIPSEANRLDSLINNKKYKNTSIQVNFDTKNSQSADYHTKNLNSQNLSQQQKKQKEKHYFGESAQLNQESYIISKPSLKNDMSVKFKLPSPNQNQIDMHKGQSLQQAEQLQTKKQSSLKKYLKKGQSRNEQDKMKSDKAKKQDYQNQQKMQNKNLQKFETKMRSLFSNKEQKKEQFAQNFNSYIQQLKMMQDQISIHNQYNQINHSKSALDLEDIYLLKTQFEKMKQYNVYYPHNNFSKVIQDFSKVQLCNMKKIQWRKQIENEKTKLEIFMEKFNNNRNTINKK